MKEMHTSMQLSVFKRFDHFKNVAFKFSFSDPKQLDNVNNFEF